MRQFRGGGAYGLLVLAGNAPATERQRCFDFAFLAQKGWVGLARPAQPPVGPAALTTANRTFNFRLLGRAGQCHFLPE
jgi:hypothetical protein